MTNADTNYQVNLKADIVPGLSLGGLRLGTSLRELSTWLSRLELDGGLTYDMPGLFEARYQLGQGTLELAVDIRAGKIARLTAHPGYQGTLFGSLRLGMLAGEAMRMDRRLYYDEAQEVILCRDIPGVALDVPEQDPDPARVPELPVSAISIYVGELDTAAGQLGDW